MTTGATKPFDPLEHHRRRARHAEARAETLEAINARLYRILTLTALVAVRNTTINPLELLAAIEDLDNAA